MEMILLEKLEVGALYHSHAAKVDKVNLNLSRTADLMNDSPVEPQSFRRHTADLAPSHKLLRQAVPF